VGVVAGEVLVVGVDGVVAGVVVEDVVLLVLGVVADVVGVVGVVDGGLLDF
jgi:hypothetical protein